MPNLYSPSKQFPCYVLSYMYFMLMVTNGISMYAIKPLKELSTDKKYSYSVMPKRLKNLYMYSSFSKNKVVREKKRIKEKEYSHTL